MVKSRKDYNAVAWKDIVYYDETSPSCLRWNEDYCWTGRYFRVKKGEIAGTCSNNRWVVVYQNTKYLVHRVVWILFNKVIDNSKVVDHIDRDSSNNKITNLRVVSEAENLRNPSKFRTNTSGVTGVIKLKDRRGNLIGWMATWWENGKGHQRRFRFSTHGDEAFNLAVQFRKDSITRLNLLGYNYSANHGQ